MSIKTFTEADALASFSNAKRLIRECVRGYKVLYPEEYTAVIEQIRDKKAALYDERFGRAHHEKDTQMRALYEMPETLYNAIHKVLDEDELLWFTNGTPSDRNAGGRWFATTFPEFKIPEEI